MKIKISTLVLLISMLSVAFFSCSSDNEEFTFDNSALLDNLKQEAIKFENKLNNSVHSKSLSSLNNINQGDLNGMLQNSIALIKSYGITESEIILEFGSLDNPAIIEAGLSIAQIENQADYGIEMIDVNDSSSLLTGENVDMDMHDNLGQKSMAANSDVYDCALQAIGITAIGELISNGIKNMSKSAVKKVLKKVAAKYLGWVGVAIAAYEFGDCMQWW